jgi:hypothetical protein
MTADRYPNLFIAGVPKAATTTWYTVLDRHPDVYMPDKKEPRFLNTDFTFDFRVETEEEYLSLYEDAGDEHRRGGGAPPRLYREEATPKIPQPGDVPPHGALVRDPRERTRAKKRGCRTRQRTGCTRKKVYPCGQETQSG